METRSQLTTDALFGSAGSVETRTGLAVAWSLLGSDRIGEVCLPPPGTEVVLGRGDDGRRPRVQLARYRPGGVVPTAPLSEPRISRDQLELVGGEGTLGVCNIGRCAMSSNGRPVDEATLRPGDVLELSNQLVLVCVERRLGGTARTQVADMPFGRPDPVGMVGESAAIWRLRAELAFVGRRDGHVLVLGPSGVGKELAAQALHTHSSRRRKRLVSRNAATLPPGLVDAELFGNAANYPNPGMQARPGLVGQADGGTLFLDEIGELPHALQSHLLRVLDADGEYQRLGEGEVRRSDFRLVAATNRSASALKSDFGARFLLHLSVPGLEERQEDVPLLVYHLLRGACADPELGSRLLDEGGVPRVSPALMTALLRHRYTLHVRELHALLWAAITSSEGHFLDLTEAVRDRLTPIEDAEVPARAPGSVGPDEIEAALDAAGGSMTAAARALGLSSRHALYRRMKKLDIPSPS